MDLISLEEVTGVAYLIERLIGRLIHSFWRLSSLLHHLSGRLNAHFLHIFKSQIRHLLHSRCLGLLSLLIHGPDLLWLEGQMQFVFVLGWLRTEIIKILHLEHEFLGIWLVWIKDLLVWGLILSYHGWLDLKVIVIIARIRSFKRYRRRTSFCERWIEKGFLNLCICSIIMRWLIFEGILRLYSFVKTLTLILLYSWSFLHRVIV